MPNFRVGLVMTACLPASPALSTLELLAGRVVLIPFDRSAVVEGTVCPTTASSPGAEIRGILAAGLGKSKYSSQNQQIEDESTRLELTNYLPVTSSLRGAVALPHY
jgi:hypothetical protein